MKVFHLRILLPLMLSSMTLTSVQAAPLSDWYEQRQQEINPFREIADSKKAEEANEEAKAKAKKDSSKEEKSSKSQKASSKEEKSSKSQKASSKEEKSSKSQKASSREGTKEEGQQEKADKAKGKKKQTIDQDNGANENAKTALDQSLEVKAGLTEKESPEGSSQEPYETAPIENGYANPQKQLTLRETELKSPAFGYATIGRSMLPEGWSVYVTDLTLGTESITCPNAVWVTVTSPSQDVSLTYISRRDFYQEYYTAMGFESSSQDDAYDWGSLKYYWNYKDARQVCDIFAEALSGYPASPISVYTFSQEEEDSLIEAYKNYDSEIRYAISAYTQGEILWTELSSEKVTYDLGEERLTVYSCVSGYQYEFAYLNYLMRYTNWMIPQLFAIRTPAEDHDAYEELFDVFCATTSVSQEYALLREKNAQELLRAVLEAQENQWSSPSINETTLSENQEETIEKGDTYSAFEAWDDLIRDETDYVTGDGSHVKISSQYDHVFEGDDGTIYAGFDVDGPIGSTELFPSQIGE